MKTQARPGAPRPGGLCAFRFIPQIVLLLVCAATSAPAASLSLGAMKDNSLYFNLAGAVSNGRGPTVFAGNNAGNATRRGLLAFDLSAIPAGSTIETVTLDLYLVQAQSFPTDVSLHRATTDWGEGTSNAGIRGGAGTTATAGDATWIHAKNPGSLWLVPGGDFLPAASAATLVANEGAVYTWTSTAALLADVQGWVNNPSANFGWVLRGDETQGATAKAFASREYFDSSLQPRLTISYSPVPEPALAAAAIPLLLVVFLARRRYSRPASGPPSA